MPGKTGSRVTNFMHVIGTVSLVIGISSLIMFSVGLYSLGLDLARLHSSGYSMLFSSMPVMLLIFGSALMVIGLIKDMLLAILCSATFFGAGLLMGMAEGIFSLYSTETTAFIGTGTVVLVLGFIFYKFLYRKDAVISVLNALGIVAFLWLAIPLVHSLPLAFTVKIPLSDAFFESVMGFTGTGLTVFTGGPDHNGVYIPRVSELSQPILLWRGIIQWVGGIGVVVMSMAIIAQPSIGLVVLTEVEGRLEKLEPTIRRTAVQMFKLYLAMTAMSFALLYISGMGVFDALCHALTGISTAGFSTRDDSFASFTLPIKIGGILVMILGASNFHDIYLARKRIWVFLRSVELRATLFVIFLATLASIGMFKLHKIYHVSDIVFQIVSALTTTGWQSIDLSTAPTQFKMLLIILIFIGGSIFSTAGSVKILRYVVLLKYLKEEVNKMGKPRGYQSLLKIGRYTFSPDSVGRAALVMFLYFLTYNIGLAVAFAMIGQDVRTDNLYFEVASALGNIGLSTGIAGAPLSLGVKLELILLSIMGRLEIFPVIVLFYKLFSSIPPKRRTSSTQGEKL